MFYGRKMISWGRWYRVGSALALGGIALAMIVLALARGMTSAATLPTAPVLHMTEMQALIDVWASGTPEIQELAQQSCVQQRLTVGQCAAVSAQVRQTWQQLAVQDPAATGRVGTPSHAAAQRQLLRTLSRQLDTVTQGGAPSLLASTQAVAARIHDPRWLRQMQTVYARPIPLPGSLTAITVWATSFMETSQNGLPTGMDPTSSPYVALPDQYLKDANTGASSAIPAIYQPYYALRGGNLWKVSITTADGKQSVSNVPITDVGPWNEDDNWWDANGSSAVPPPGCPIATVLIASDATSNALINGICPSGHNQRRLYYYLLYQHGGLPFFQSASYAPSGAFRDGSAWPLGLPTNCAETVVAAINNEGMACRGVGGGYNANNGSWLREAQYDSPILNQSSIDLSPAVDAALGWTYPSSGLVRVVVANLP